MKKHVLVAFCALIFLRPDFARGQTKVASSLSYYFNSPASRWTEAIPIGNGRLGGMVSGGIGQEKIETNDDTFWSGEPRDLQKPGTYRYLDEIRKLIREGKNAEAGQLINKHMLGPWNQSYMPLVDILLTMGDSTATDYRRELDLSRGIVTISYRQAGVNYKREIFSSYPDQTIVIRISADKKKSVNIIAELKSKIKNNVIAQKDQLIISGQAPKHVEPNYQGVHAPVYEEGHGMRFEGRLMIKETDGEIMTGGDKLELRNASAVTFIFVAATSYNGFDKDPFKEGKDERKLCEAYLSGLNGKNFRELYKRHVDDYTQLFGRVTIDLGINSDAALPVDQRIRNYRNGSDPALTALYFQFGRYLLISSSRPGSQPANLQGIWNDLLQPAWSANWTLNCNAQINYWPVEVANLSECHLPLMDLIREATVDGSKTAKNLYNARGWVAHHNIDIWRTTWPVGGNGLWAIYQVGGAWLCQHIWEHYLFTQDKAFLNEYYPVLEEATHFYLDNLQEDNNGNLVTNPAVSFENNYKKPNGEKGWACMGASQDMQIIRSLFQHTMEAVDILGKDQAFKAGVLHVYNRLAPMKISPVTGQLQEWNDDWYPENPHNDQVAQGWGLVAGDLIHVRKTPELARAFRKTVEARRPGYGANSGSWTGAFAASFWAGLEEADSVQMIIDRHFDLALFPNLTCNFTGFWQIDGNLGITAAIAAMLLQSQGGEISILPALPSKYAAGYVKGLKARGGFEVDIYWKKGVLLKTVIRSATGGNIPVRYRDKVKEIHVKPSGEVTLKLTDFS